MKLVSGGLFQYFESADLQVCCDGGAQEAEIQWGWMLWTPIERLTEFIFYTVIKEITMVKDFFIVLNRRLVQRDLGCKPRGQWEDCVFLCPLLTQTLMDELQVSVGWELQFCELYMAGISQKCRTYGLIKTKMCGILLFHLETGCYVGTEGFLCCWSSVLWVQWNIK